MKLWKLKIQNIMELFCSSRYHDGIHGPCPHRSPRAHIKHKQTYKNIIAEVRNPDNWWTQDCPPQDCPLGGNPEAGNPESISYQDCPPQLLCFLCIVCAWYGPWVSAGDMRCVFHRNILKKNYSRLLWKNFFFKISWFCSFFNLGAKLIRWKWIGGM